MSLRGPVAASLLLAGCDAVFDLVPVKDAAFTDAETDAGRPPCPAPIVDRFDSPPICGWGTKLESDATIALVGGALHITPSAGTGFASCTAGIAYPVPETGIVAEVSAVGGDAWFGFRGSTEALVVYYAGGNLHLSRATIENLATVEYVASEMRWWRIRPDLSKGSFLAEYSSDGFVFTAFGESRDHAIAGSYRLTLGAGGAMAQQPGMAVFEGVNVCD